MNDDDVQALRAELDEARGIVAMLIPLTRRGDWLPWGAETAEAYLRREGRPRYGTISTNERIFPIDRIYLGAGKVNVEFTIPEGVAADLRETSWMIHGPDGGLVVRGQWSDVGVKPEAGIWVVTLDLGYVDKLTERAKASGSVR